MSPKDIQAPQAFAPSVQLNLNIRGLGLSATLAINERSAALMKQGRKVSKLGLGQSPFPVPDVMQKALRDNAFQKDYLPVQGLYSLRESICRYLERTQGLDFDPKTFWWGLAPKS
jgi:aspartate aminotransferase